jgi:hypothetical protein
MLWWIIGSIVGYLAVGSFMAGASDCKNCDDATLTVFLEPILLPFLPFFGIAELGLKCRKARLQSCKAAKRSTTDETIARI